MSSPWTILLLASFNVDGTTLAKAVLGLMAIGGTGFLYLTRVKK